MQSEPVESSPGAADGFLLFVVIPQLFFLASFSWGIGAAVGATTYVKLMKGQGGLAVARDERGRRKTALNGNGATPLCR